jgi:hypothetical protein
MRRSERYHLDYREDQQTRLLASRATFADMNLQNPLESGG